MPGPRPTAPGHLIVLEGIDGSGKSTLAAWLTERLIKTGHEAVRRQEPTDGPAGQELRRIISEGRKGIAPEAETALFIEDRRQHVAGGIGPDLEAGRVVVLDRYYLSTAAYQGALGMDPEAIMAENEAFAPPPDLALLLDLPVPTALDRIILGREGKRSAFEKEAYLEKVRRIFLGINRPWFHRIDADCPPPRLQEAVITLLRDELPGLIAKVDR
jgi:dTMP kinase